MLKRFCCVPAAAAEVECVPLAAAMGSPTRIFEDISMNLEVCGAGARCISWVFHRGCYCRMNVVFGWDQIQGKLAPVSWIERNL
ncbi:hypothetical protein BDM02DRAFT_3116279, partial [Thelephora ganbajun]